MCALGGCSDSVGYVLMQTERTRYSFYMLTTCASAHCAPTQDVSNSVFSETTVLGGKTQPSFRLNGWCGTSEVSVLKSPMMSPN